MVSTPIWLNSAHHWRLAVGHLAAITPLTSYGVSDCWRIYDRRETKLQHVAPRALYFITWLASNIVSIVTVARDWNTCHYPPWVVSLKLHVFSPMHTWPSWTYTRSLGKQVPDYLIVCVRLVATTHDELPSLLRAAPWQARKQEVESAVQPIHCIASVHRTSGQIKVAKLTKVQWPNSNCVLDISRLNCCSEPEVEWLPPCYSSCIICCVLWCVVPLIQVTLLCTQMLISPPWH